MTVDTVHKGPEGGHKWQEVPSQRAHPKRPNDVEKGRRGNSRGSGLRPSSHGHSGASRPNTGNASGGEHASNDPNPMHSAFTSFFLGLGSNSLRTKASSNIRSSNFRILRTTSLKPTQLHPIQLHPIQLQPTQLQRHQLQRTHDQRSNTHLRKASDQQENECRLQTKEK